MQQPCELLANQRSSKTRAGSWLILLLVAALLGGTAIGCRSVYYGTYEKFGVYKRDLLKKRVIEARDDQQVAQLQFKDTLTRLKEITHFDGGEAERAYTSLNTEYETCVKRADAVSARIRAVETVAEDLFAEWDRENNEISSPALRASSAKQLAAAKQRYDDLHKALVNAERTMPPVLRQFKDYVIYLKHNLNAQAISSLQGESLSIQTEIGKLIEQMNRSIARADEYVKTMQ
jgi:hypothetical protein